MSFTGKIIPAAEWPSTIVVNEDGDALNKANMLPQAQAYANALRVLQLGNLDMTEKAYSTASVCGFGDASGSVLPWAGKIRVVAGLAANRSGYRDMVGGDWTTEGLLNVADSLSVAAIGSTLACQSYRYDADYSSMVFFDTSGAVSGESHPDLTGSDQNFKALCYSAYSGLFVLLAKSSAVYRIHTTPGTGATPTWTSRQVWADSSVDDQIAIDTTGQYILVTGANYSYMSQDGGLTWTATAVNCHSTAIIWDPLNNRWLRAHDTALTWNTTAGILAGTAWTARFTFGSNCTSFVGLPGGMLLARLSSAIAYRSEDAGTSWVKIANGVGALKYCGGYVAVFAGSENTYISRRVG